MKQLGCYVALFFMTLGTYHAQAQMQVDEVKVTHSSKETDDSKRIIADIQLSPIPAKDVLNLQFQTRQATSIHIQISSIMGRIIHEKIIAINDGLHTKTFNIENFPRGTYFLSIGTGQHTQTKRFVKR